MPIISDVWPGLDAFFTPGRGDPVRRRDRRTWCAWLARLDEPARRAIGEAARRRVLEAHTAAHRARELETYLHRRRRAAPQCPPPDAQPEPQGSMNAGQPKTILVTGGAGFHRFASVRGAAAPRSPGLLPRQLPDRHAHQHRRSRGQSALSAHSRHDVTQQLPRLPRIDEIYNLACAASPPHYQPRSRAHHADQRARCAAPAGAGPAHRCPLLQASTSEVYGDPAVHPQPESLLGPCQPDRPARLLRRGQAGGRDPVLRLPPAPRPDRSRWPASSTPMGRAWRRRTAGSSRP